MGAFEIDEAQGPRVKPAKKSTPLDGDSDLEPAAYDPKPKKLKHTTNASGIRGPPDGALLLSRVQVLDLLGVTYTTLWTWMRHGEFPLAISLGPPGGQRSKIAWHSAEVLAWIASRPRRVPLPPPSKTRRAVSK